MDVSRYNFGCQKALHQGLQYARSFGNESLEVEHVALALLRSDSLEIPDQAALQQTLRNYLNNLPKTFGNISVEFGKRLDLALDEAEAKAQKTIIEENLLWQALISQSDTIKNFQKQKTKAQDPIITEQNGSKAQPIKAAPTPKTKKAATNKAIKIPEKLEKVLREYTIDLSALAESSELDPVIGRDLETRRVLEILGRKKKNNPILIGPAGVGKTTVAERLAQKIALAEVPESMRAKRVLSLDLSALLAGARYRGDFEERLKNLLAAIQLSDGEIILFIDEIHMLVGAGASDGSIDAANLLKPALARGELRCLGATTYDEYRKYIEKDPALERRFQAVHVAEPSRDLALSILRGIKSHYQVHHGVQIHDDALISAVDLSIRFLPSRQLPDKAIDLLDEACSKLRLQIDSSPLALEELASQIEQLEIENKSLEETLANKGNRLKIQTQLKELQKNHKEVNDIWQNHKSLLEKLRRAQATDQELNDLFQSSKQKGEFDLAARLQFQEIPSATKQTDALEAELTNLESKHSFLRKFVGEADIAEILHKWTGIPVGKLLKEDVAKLLGLEKRLKTRIFGQNQAISAVSNALKRSYVDINDPNRPIGVFLFLGPTGVGKTETAKALAEELFSNENQILRIDMSEFMEQHSVARLLGSPPGYIGHGEGGELTEPIRLNPYKLVLFDEIEKAHPLVLDILLQIFDDGRLTDSKGQTINFKNTLIIMTSNMKVERTSNLSPEQADEASRSQLAAKLRPEFVGRIDELVFFDPLNDSHLKNLLNKYLKQLNQRLAKRQFKVVLGKNLKDFLIASASKSNFGGRAMKRVFERYAVDEISKRILFFPGLCKGAWQLEKNGASFTWLVDDTPGRYLANSNDAA